MDTTQVNQVINAVSEIAVESTPTNWWMIVAIIELVVIIVLLLVKMRASEKGQQNIKEDILQNSSNEDIDWKNIMQSSFHARELYKSLLVKCHPDRFVHDKALQEKALAISSQLGKHRNDYKKLLEIKEQVINELNINL